MDRTPLLSLVVVEDTVCTSVFRLTERSGGSAWRNSLRGTGDASRLFIRPYAHIRSLSLTFFFLPVVDSHSVKSLTEAGRE